MNVKLGSSWLEKVNGALREGVGEHVRKARNWQYLYTRYPETHRAHSWKIVVIDKVITARSEMAGITKKGVLWLPIDHDVILYFAPF